MGDESNFCPLVRRGHVACAFLIIRFDTFFFNCQCRNFHPEVSKIVHAQGPEKHHFYVDPLSTIFLPELSHNPQASGHCPAGARYVPPMLLALSNRTPSARDLTAQWLLDKLVEGSIGGVCGGFRCEENERERESSTREVSNNWARVGVFNDRDEKSYKNEWVLAMETVVSKYKHRLIVILSCPWACFFRDINLHIDLIASLNCLVVSLSCLAVIILWNQVRCSDILHVSLFLAMVLLIELQTITMELLGPADKLEFPDNFWLSPHLFLDTR